MGDDLFGRWCSAFGDFVGGIGVASECDFVAPGERAVERRTNTCVGLGTSDDESTDASCRQSCSSEVSSKASP